jgi:uncharacterized phage infection (PIP) family protein YhgE
MTGSRPLDLQGGLRRLSTGLIAYGAIGLVVAAIAFGALIWVNGRISGLRSEVETTIAQLATTTERTTTALRDASTTAGTFSATLEQAANAMPSASQRIAGLRDDLSSLEAQLRSVNILGATPLGSAADAVGKISTSLEGIDTQLSLVGVALTANSQALAGNATSLARLADSTDAIATRLGSGVVEDSLGDVQTVIVVVLLVFTALSLVPAVGSLAFGVWLRRLLEGSVA